MEPSPHNRIEHAFEILLWRSRLIVLAAVIGSMLIAAAALFMATVDAVYLTGYLAPYADPQTTPQARAETRTHIITAIVKCVDGYLIGAIMVIFAIGLYELFINRINVGDVSDSTPRLLRIDTLDDLKDRLAKVVLLLLTIEFFQHAMQLNYTRTLELLYLAAGILLLAGALYLSNTRTKTGE
jgi:uncharacterized membrane protein YqhA